MNPKVSVIIPIYNVEKYIERCLESVLNQTLKELEVIIVDDGSTDKSIDIVNEYIKDRKANIKIYTKSNGGLSDARNFGMKFVHGEFIAFLDSDDYIDLDLYEKLYASSENKKIVACGYKKEWENGRYIEEKNGECDSLEKYIVNGLVVAWNKLYKRSWLEEINIKFEKGMYFEDLEFFYKIISHLNSVNEIEILDITPIHYIQRDSSISHIAIGHADDVIKSCQNVLLYYQNNNVDYNLKEAVEYKYVKNLLGRFLVKYMEIPDYKIRRKKIRYNWKFINKTFPDWKKNKYIKSLKGYNGFFLRIMNKPIYWFFTYVPVKWIKRVID